MVGWVNVYSTAGNLTVEPGFKKDVTLEEDFLNEFDEEVERLRFFLQT